MPMQTQDTPPQRAVPANLEAEEAVLGSLIISPNAINDVVLLLSPDDFYSDRNRWIYEAILKLHSRHQPPDFVTLSSELEQNGRLEEVGGPAYLTSLINSVPTAIHAEYYANLVVQASIRRRLLRAASQIASLAYEDADDAKELVDRAEQLIFAIAERGIRRDVRKIGEVLDKVLERIQELRLAEDEVYGVPTGFRDLDALLGGLQRSDLVILAGRPSMGKTSLALSIARNAASKGKKVGVFSLEMSAEQLVHRLLAAESKIDSRKIIRGRVSDAEFEKLVVTAGELGDVYMYIDDTPSLSVMGLRSKARRIYSEYGLDLIVIDYLQLMQGDFRAENRVQEISYISRALKSLAREMNIPVLALSQLSRAVEQRQDKHPLLSDLRESGSIEQDADVVIFIYREVKYKEDTEKKTIAELSIAKHRNGPTGKVELYFDERYTFFKDLALQKVSLDREREEPYGFGEDLVV